MIQQVTDITGQVGWPGVLAFIILGANQGVKLYKELKNGKGSKGDLLSPDKLWFTEQFTLNRHDVRNIVAGLPIDELNNNLAKIGINLEHISRQLDRRSV